MDGIDYMTALDERDAVEAKLNVAYDAAAQLQREYNDINGQIEDYEQEQAVLDE